MEIIAEIIVHDESEANRIEEALRSKGYTVGFLRNEGNNIVYGIYQ